VPREDAFRAELAEDVWRFYPEHRVDADALWAREEVVGSADEVADDERLAVVQRGLGPPRPVDGLDDLVVGVRESTDEVLRRSVHVDVHERRDVDGDVVAPRERRRVPGVAPHRHDDATDLAEVGEQVVDALGVDGVDQPDVSLHSDCVTRPAHRLLRVRHPPDAAVEAVDHLEVGRQSASFEGHISWYGRYTHKTR